MLAEKVLLEGCDPLDVIAPFEVLHAGGRGVDRCAHRRPGLGRRATRCRQRDWREWTMVVELR